MPSRGFENTKINGLNSFPRGIQHNRKGNLKVITNPLDKFGFFKKIW